VYHNIHSNPEERADREREIYKKASAKPFSNFLLPKSLLFCLSASLKAIFLSLSLSFPSAYTTKLLHSSPAHVSCPDHHHHHHHLCSSKKRPSFLLVSQHGCMQTTSSSTPLALLALHLHSRTLSWLKNNFRLQIQAKLPVFRPLLGILA
jgi:hypothetical protein